MGSIQQLLIERKSTIIQEWFKIVTETYPEETARFLQRQKDPFQNPVGNATMQSLNGILEMIFDASEMNPSSLEDILDPIIRIRAVQSFTPSEAVGFVFDLKTIIPTLPGMDETDPAWMDQMRVLESRIDQVALAAFNVYMRCREKIYEIKALEERKRTYSAFRRAGLVSELSSEGSKEAERT